jgi:hypothetical protein
MWTIVTDRQLLVLGRHPRHARHARVPGCLRSGSVSQSGGRRACPAPWLDHGSTTAPRLPRARTASQNYVARQDVHAASTRASAQSASRRFGAAARGTHEDLRVGEMPSPCVETSPGVAAWRSPERARERWPRRRWSVHFEPARWLVKARGITRTARWDVQHQPARLLEVDGTSHGLDVGNSGLDRSNRSTAAAGHTPPMNTTHATVCVDDAVRRAQPGGWVTSSHEPRARAETAVLT